MTYPAQCSGRQKLAVDRATLPRPVSVCDDGGVGAAGVSGPGFPPRRPRRTPGIGHQLALVGAAAGAIVVAVLPGLQNPVATGRLVGLEEDTT